LIKTLLVVVRPPLEEFTKITLMSSWALVDIENNAFTKWHESITPEQQYLMLTCAHGFVSVVSDVLLCTVGH